jgi:hypothetical protein
MKPPDVPSRSRAARALLLLLWTQFVCLGPQAAHAQVSTADEDDIRAAMLLNLAKFIAWPATKFETPQSPFLVCLLGSDPIGPDLERYLRNQSVDGRPVQLRSIATVDLANSCHILYIGTADRKGLDRAAPDLMKNGVLTVSERPGAASPKQIIGLPAIDEHVHIDVNLGNAQRSGLTISSKLLRLATVLP